MQGSADQPDGRGDAPRWGERAYEERIHDYYKTDRYWINPMP